MAYLFDVKITRLKKDGTGEAAQLATVPSIGWFGLSREYPDIAQVANAIPKQLLGAFERETGYSEVSESGNRYWRGLWYPSRGAGFEFNCTLKNVRGLPIARLAFKGYEFGGEA